MAGACDAAMVESAFAPTEHDAEILREAPVLEGLKRSIAKCGNCRRRKTKCQPTHRSWPDDGKCEACERRGLDCGPMIERMPPGLRKHRKELETTRGIVLASPVNTNSFAVDIAESGTSSARSTLAQHPAENGDQRAPDGEKRAGILDYLEAQERILFTETQELLLSSMETDLKRLSMSSNWSVIMPRLVSYIASLSTSNTTTSSWPQSLASPARTSSQTAQISETTQADHSLSRMSSMSSVGSAASSFGNKRYFCFHDSCAQDYHAGRALETHVRNFHRGRWPVLPGTCNHDGRTIHHMTWDDSLTHLIFHQKTLHMTRSDYGEMLSKAHSSINHDNVRTDNTHYASNVNFGLSPFGGFLGVDDDSQWPHGQDAFSLVDSSITGS